MFGTRKTALRKSNRAPRPFLSGYELIYEFLYYQANTDGRETPGSPKVSNAKPLPKTPTGSKERDRHKHARAIATGNGPCLHSSTHRTRRKPSFQRRVVRSSVEPARPKHRHRRRADCTLPTGAVTCPPSASPRKWRDSRRAGRAHHPYCVLCGLPCGHLRIGDRCTDADGLTRKNPT
jgi:hypothetical protein